jgi:hypothetical protein
MTNEAQTIVNGFKRLAEMDLAEAYIAIDAHWKQLIREEQRIMRAAWENGPAG